jgi:beta-N-acetylglucosaminidase
VNTATIIEAQPYLRGLCDGLDPRIEVTWTGHAVVNDEITVAQAQKRAELTGRAPLLWDNTPVNDAFMREAMHLGPYAGREPGLREAVSGARLNPMELADASAPTVASAAAWLRGEDPVAHGPRRWAICVCSPRQLHFPATRTGRMRTRATRGGSRSRSWTFADAALAPWVDHARRGARLAPTRLSTLIAYPTWAREPV